MQSHRFSTSFEKLNDTYFFQILFFLPFLHIFFNCALSERCGLHMDDFIIHQILKFQP